MTLRENDSCHHVYKQVINNPLPVQKMRVTKEMLAGRPEPPSWFCPVWIRGWSMWSEPLRADRTELHPSPSPPESRKKNDLQSFGLTGRSGEGARKSGSLLFLSVSEWQQKQREELWLRHLTPPMSDWILLGGGSVNDMKTVFIRRLDIHSTHICQGMLLLWRGSLYRKWWMSRDLWNVRQPGCSEGGFDRSVCFW